MGGNGMRGHSLVGLALVLSIGVPSTGSAACEEAKKGPPRLHLAFDEEVETTKEQGVTSRAPIPEKATSRVEAWLGPTALLVARGPGRTLYDAAGQRIRSWTEGAATSTSVPFEAPVDNRVAEFGNRIRVRDISKAAGVRMAAFDPFEMETLFGIEETAGALRGSVEVAETPEGVTFRHSGEEVVHVSWSGTEPAEGVAASWERMLRSEVRVHPVVLERVLAAKRVPALLRFRWRNVGLACRTTLRLVKAEAGEGPLAAPPPEEPGGGEPLDRALRAAASARLPTLEEARAEVRDLRGKGRALEAYLALISFSIATGVMPTEEGRALVGDEAAKAEILEFQKHLVTGSDRDRMADARDWLAGRKTPDLRHGYLLDVYRANFMGSLGDLKGACGVPASVLADHPELVGAWSDLGGYYRDSWDMDRAWLCWEQALRLSPEHPMLARARGIRDALRKDHAVLFR